MPDARREITEQMMNAVTRILAAHFGIISGERLRQEDGAAARATTGREELSVIAVDKILRFIGPEEHGPLLVLCGQRVARQHRPLPHIFDQLLRDDPIFVAGEGGHIEQQYCPVEA